MAEKFTDIEMKPLELEQPVSAKRQSFARQHSQHVQYSLEHSSKISENVNTEYQHLVTTESKNDDDGGNKLKAPFTWRLLEEHKYSPYIKRFFRFIAILNILSLAVNGPAIPAEYLSTTEGFCENSEEKRMHFIILLVVDIVLSVLFTLLLFIRMQNSRHWHKLRRLKVFMATVCMFNI